MENTNGDYEIFKHFSSDPEEIERILDNEDDPPLLYVLNEELISIQLFNLAEDRYLFAQEYQGQQRMTIAPRLYKKPRKRDDKMDPKLLARCSSAKKWVNKGNSDSPTILDLVHDPLEVLVCPELEDFQLEMMKNAYQINRRKHNGETYDAIACVYYDKNYIPPEATVIQGPIVFS